MMKISVVIASLGRPTEVGYLIEALGRQTRAPDSIVLSVTKPGDLPADLSPDIVVVMGEKGLPAQRNRGMAAAIDGGGEIVVFFDDDYVPSVRALEDMEALFLQNADLVGLTGNVLADGIKGPGLALAEALALNQRYELNSSRHLEWRPTYSLYGCNMAYRVSAIGDRRFDEALPLYAWQEDTDFSRQMSSAGVLAISNGFAGVHLGVKGARTSGFLFGWSQVVNPAYLVRKGTLSTAYGLRRIFKNVFANHFRVLKPEAWIDRWGRLRGNYAAFAYLLSGRCDPSALPRSDKSSR